MPVPMLPSPANDDRMETLNRYLADRKRNEVYRPERRDLSSCAKRHKMKVRGPMDRKAIRVRYLRRRRRYLLAWGRFEDLQREGLA